MSPDSADPIPPPAGKATDAKLIRNVRELCFRVVRGKAAAQNWSVWWQRVLGIASILLSSLGSVGVIADKATGNMSDQSGSKFWGSVMLLVIGILSQIANQFRVAQRAADSESLAVRCGLYETRLTDMLMDDDPQTAVADLFVEVTTLFQSERYNVVLPRETDKHKETAKLWAGDLIARHQPFWQLKLNKVTRRTKRPVSPPAPDTQPPPNSERRQDT